MPSRGAPRKGGGFRINDEIRIRQVRLVDADGAMKGVVPTEEAMQMARDAALDLVEVSPNADPPVCKILDYGKFKYEQKKRDHDAKRKQRGGDFKEIRFRPKTERHDLDIKMDRVRRFLMQGDRVQITMVFRGREMQHMSMSYEVLNSLVKGFEDIAKIERSPTREGRRAFIGLMPKPGLKLEPRGSHRPEDEPEEDDFDDEDLEEDDEEEEAGESPAPPRAPEQAAEGAPPPA